MDDDEHLLQSGVRFYELEKREVLPSEDHQKVCHENESMERNHRGAIRVRLSSQASVNLSSSALAHRFARGRMVFNFVRTYFTLVR